MIRSLTMFALGLTLCAPALATDHTARHGSGAKPVTFTVRIENVSRGEALALSTGGRAAFVVAPGLWALLDEDGRLFSPKRHDDGKGLEALAEDGDPSRLAASLTGARGVRATGTFDTPVGASKAGPLPPGGTYEFSIEAMPGTRLALVEMFGQSNDLFYGTDPAGIRLFDRSGRPVRGDITRKLTLWDAGTEVNQEPGLGADQAPRQTGANQGMAERAPIRPVRDTFRYPRTAEVLRVTIIPEIGGM